MFRILLILLLSMTLIGCSNNNDENNPQASSATHPPVVEEAIALVSEERDVNKVQAIANEENLVIAFKVNSLKNFQLKKIKKSIKEKVEKNFPDYDVTVSTDLKIMLELNKLQEEQDTLSEDEFKQALQKIIDLEKEET
ncbi:YhcN/YlaJ family sporulation lipoprotein [Ornithinibacillus sp. 4-3]|uniref:YhcN/YlaJ family sporulation lipoprotein n=1 Tax=Ornithinibacillus sp. 4-3 TaxID=3231488 RepID=A0AB39HUL5_9BACI